MVSSQIGYDPNEALRNVQSAIFETRRIAERLNRENDLCAMEVAAGLKNNGESDTNGGVHSEEAHITRYELD